MKAIDRLKYVMREAEDTSRETDKTAIGKLKGILSPITTQIQGELASDIPLTAQVLGNLLSEFNKEFSAKANRRGVKVKYQWYPTIEAKNYPDVKALDGLGIKSVDHATAQGIYDLAKHELITSKSELRKSPVQGDVFVRRFIGPHELTGNDNDVDEWAINFLVDLGGITANAHVMLSDSQQAVNLRNRYKKEQEGQPDTTDNKVKRTISVVVSILEKAEFHSKEIAK